MGCGCKGSTPQASRESARDRRKATQEAANVRRTDGPGKPNYYWNGPQTASSK